MHTHFSAVSVLNVFVAVLIAGTLWRLLSARAMASKNSTVSTLGQAMSFQY